MRMRERLAFFNGTDRSEHPLEHASTAESSSDAGVDHEIAVEDDNGPRSSVDRIGGALETIGQIMGGEIDSLHESIAERESGLARRIEMEKGLTTASIDALRNELFARIEDLRSAQRKEVGELTDPLKTRTSALEEALRRGDARAEARSEEVRISLEQIVSEKEIKLEHDLEVLSKNLTRAQLHLQQLSTLLNSVAGIFSDHQTRDPQSRPATRSPVGAPQEDRALEPAR